MKIYDWCWWIIDKIKKIHVFEILHVDWHFNRSTPTERKNQDRYNAATKAERIELDKEVLPAGHGRIAHLSNRALNKEAGRKIAGIFGRWIMPRGDAEQWLKKILSEKDQ